VVVVVVVGWWWMVDVNLLLFFFFLFFDPNLFLFIFFFFCDRWANLELTKRYDSCRTLYGPEKVYGHHDPHQEAVAAVKTFPKTR
jgi:hypothetical protein